MSELKLKVLIGATALALMGCVPDPQQFATPPVEVSTPKGAIICQLYTRSTVAWDRAVSFPAGYTSIAADEFCKSEGRKRGGK